MSILYLYAERCFRIFAHAGFRTGNFLPARNFMEVIPEIEKSEVFKILLDLPKGAVLHCHDSAIVSPDYMFHNFTYRDNLYVCDVNDTLTLKFFNIPDSECHWQLLSDVRRDPVQAGIINDRIKKQMTMLTENPTKDYDTVDKAWAKFNSIFTFLSPILSYKPVYEDHFYRGFQELYEDNVMYMELRSTLKELYDLDGKRYESSETAKILKEVVDR